MIEKHSFELKNKILLLDLKYKYVNIVILFYIYFCFFLPIVVEGKLE